MTIIQTHTVPDQVKADRLDSYAVKIFEIFSTRKSSKKAIKRGEILVNKAVAEPFIRVKPGQVIELIESKRNPPKVYKLELKVLFEDDWLAIVEKLPGLVVNGNQFKTLENSLAYNLEPSHQNDKLLHPAPVHRLDAATGGLLVAAKTSKSIVKLSELFQNRMIKKQYRALVVGNLKGSGKIENSIDGRDAITKFQVIGHAPSLKNKTITSVDLYPETGRCHQLRKHLASIGHPVLGDKLYGTEQPILRSKGLFLWAISLSFNHPITGDDIFVQTQLPQKFKTYVDRELRRWEKYYKN